MLVDEFLTNTARRSPDKIALVVDQRRVSYAELDELSARLAYGLRDLGVARGDRVVIQTENSVETVVSIFAALKAGAIFVVVNPTVKTDKLVFILNNSRAVALISDRCRSLSSSEIFDRAKSVRAIVAISSAADRTRQAGTIALADLLSFRPVEDLKHRSIDVDLAALIYTSGSTANPKGVMLTHANIVSAATSITAYLQNSADDIILSVLPLSFDYGLYQVLMAVKFGGTVILERSFAYPHDVLEKVAAERITGLPIVPTISALLLQRDLSAYDFSSVRYITNTAAALPTKHITEIRRLLPHVKLYSMYGLTECKRVSFLPPEEIDERPTSVGKAMPNVEVYLVDDAGNRLDSGTGELVIRGSNVMRGYWELPAETDRVLRQGPFPGERVLYSGDLFRIDESGYLYFVARKDEIIKTRGEKVSPQEIENVIVALDGVLEAAVIGLPDPVLGQAIKAVVTLKDGATLCERDILRQCANHLEDFMVPRTVEILKLLPQTSSGKISRKMLVGWFRQIPRS